MHHTSSEFTRQTESIKVVYSHRPPILVSLMFSAILAEAFQDCDDCFPIRYRVNGNLFNFWLEANSKIQTDVQDELLYVGCVAKNVLTEKMQDAMDRVSQLVTNMISQLERKRMGYVTTSTWKAQNEANHHSD